jgi:hypothetical protein
VTPSATSPGLYDVHAVIGIHRDGPSANTTMEDLSLQVELNPTAGDPHYGWIELTVEYDPSTDPGTGCVDASACGGGCGEGYVDGVTEGLLCLPEGACSPTCNCVCKFPPITATFPDKALQPGDALDVVLTPSPRTEPDADPSDDQMGYTFTGDPVLWDRRVDSVALQPVAGGGYDIVVDGTIFHEGILNFLPPGEPAALDVFFEVDVGYATGGSTSVASGTIDFRPVPLAVVCTCGNACATWDGQTHNCQPFIPSSPDCYCGWAWRQTIPAVPLGPGDEIMVLLRPAPGALPELPGFEDDDDDSLTCCSDPTGVEVFSASVEDLLARNFPNPFSKGTDISFSVPARTDVRLEVFDLHGRRTRTLMDGSAVDAGRHSVSWDGRTAAGSRAPAGIYFARITADGRTETRKMTLIH